MFGRRLSLPTPRLPPVHLPAMPILLLSDRFATLILSVAGTAANLYATYKLITTWFSVRWTWSGTEESEWEGLSWRLDGARALGLILCAYFFVGGIASLVGVIGVIKRRTSNLRLYRDYSIADLAFGFTTTAIFAFVSTKPVVRSMMCEELSRQPDLLRSLSDSAGLNVENCESFLEKAIVALLFVLSVVLFIRLQFTLTVLNYYTYLRRTQQHAESVALHVCSTSSSSPTSPTTKRSHPHSHSRSNSQRILLLSKPLHSASKDKTSESTLIYAPVRLSAEQARHMDVREAFLSLGAIPERITEEGRIRLPIREGEALNEKP